MSPGARSHVPYSVCPITWVFILRSGLLRSRPSDSPVRAFLWISSHSSIIRLRERGCATSKMVPMANASPAACRLRRPAWTPSPGRHIAWRTRRNRKRRHMCRKAVRRSDSVARQTASDGLWSGWSRWGLRTACGAPGRLAGESTNPAARCQFADQSGLYTSVLSVGSFQRGRGSRSARSNRS